MTKSRSKGASSPMHLARASSSTPANASSSITSRGEQRQGDGEHPLAAGGGAGGRAPAAVLPALDRELVPGAVVERGGEVLEPGAALVARPFGGDPLLEEGADSGTVLSRPGVAGLAEQPAPRLGKPSRPVRQRLPAEAELHADRGRPLFQLVVHPPGLVLGVGDQLLELACDLVDEVLFEQLPLLGAEHPLAVGDLVAEQADELVGGAALALEDNADDVAVLGEIGGGLVAVAAERVRQLLETVREVPLDAVPRRVVGVDLGERLLDPAREP